MSELERQLAQSLTELSNQYKRDMQHLEEQNEYLYKEVSSLSKQIGDLTAQLNALEPLLRSLSSIATK